MKTIVTSALVCHSTFHIREESSHMIVGRKFTLGQVQQSQKFIVQLPMDFGVPQLKIVKTEVVTDVLKRCKTVVPQIVAKSVGTVLIGLQADIGYKRRPQTSYVKNQLD